MRLPRRDNAGVTECGLALLALLCVSDADFIWMGTLAMLGVVLGLLLVMCKESSMYDARKLLAFEFRQEGCASRSCAMLQDMTPLKSVLCIVCRVEIWVLVWISFSS